MRDVFPTTRDGWTVDRRTVGLFQTHAHLLVCDQTKKAALFDACADFEVLREMVEAHEAELVALFQTHAHLDHVGALTEMRRWSKAPIFLHPAEMPLYEQVAMQCRLFGLPPMPNPPPPDKWLRGGDSVEVGALTLQVLDTPGHTPGGISFVLGEQLLFVGDTLFAGSIGRTDLPGGDHAQLIASIETFRDLSENLWVLAGHGPSTTLGREFRTNPFYRGR